MKNTQFSRRFPENLKGMFTHYYMHSDIFNRHKYLTTQQFINKGTTKQNQVRQWSHLVFSISLLNQFILIFEFSRKSNIVIKLNPIKTANYNFRTGISTSTSLSNEESILQYFRVILKRSEELFLRYYIHSILDISILTNPTNLVL